MTRVRPARAAGLWELSFGTTRVVIDPDLGGRVRVFSLSDQNLLTGPDVHPQNFGSTFWPSPQSMWGWPPPETIDCAPYAASADAVSLTLTSRTDPRLGVVVRKTFEADPQASAVFIRYEMKNVGPLPLFCAPWQISRVPPGGLSFFPTGAEIPLRSTLPASEAGGITWFAYDRAQVRGDCKLFADGAEGWLAHLVGETVFVKKFADVVPANHAPGEAEIELYANGEHTYVELEVQGPYAVLEPGAAMIWSVQWFARKLPPGLARRAKNPELAQFVRALVD